MDTDIKLLKAYTQLCMDAHQALMDAGKDEDIFDVSLLDTLWQLGGLARELNMYMGD